MSLNGLRDELFREKTNESTACEGRRVQHLRALLRYTQLLAAGRALQVEDCHYNDPPDQDEISFLDQNDLAKGRHFNDTTLPWPNDPPLPSTLPFQSPLKPTAKSTASAVGTPSLQEQLRAASASPSVTTQVLPPTELPKNADPSSQLLPTISRVDAPLSSANDMVDDAPHASREGASPAPAVQQTVDIKDRDTDGPSVDLAAVVASDPDVDQTADPSKSSKPKAPQVVHLPPKDVQEARLRETERKLEKAAEKERVEEEKVAVPPSNGPMDLISSPSSTVGAYSQATPHAPHHSPDTSPDTESFNGLSHTVPPSTDALDPAAEQVKEDHERALQKEMREARERAREIASPTPEVEKQIEDEQAIRLARDGKSRLSESVSETQSSLVMHAGEVAREAAKPEQQTVEARAPQDLAVDSLPTPTTTAPEPSTIEPDVTEPDTRKPEETDSHPTPPADVDIEMADVPAPKSQTTPARPSRADRTTARLSSGSNQQKSVSEIITENAAPKAVLTPRSSNLSTSVSPPRPKTRDPGSKEVTSVVFAKKTQSSASKALQSYNEEYAALLGASEDSSRDYLEGLFKWNAHVPPRSIPLADLVSSSRKTISTSGTMAMIREGQDYKLLRRVYQLQNANRWSLRQIKKSAEPERQFTHLDQLLLEMKAMQTDFKEERKWKQALAATFANWCAEYVHSSREDQIALRVNARIPEASSSTHGGDEDINDAPTPDLMQSHAHETETESFADEDELRTPLNANPPTGIFSLGFNDVVMKIHRTSASDTMFRELPFYEPMLEGMSEEASFSEPQMLPVSRYVTGKIVSQIRGPPKKRSRYDYDSEDEQSTPPSRSGTSAEHSMPSTPGRRLFCRNDLPPEMTDVALFNAENKHVRDRLQAAHQFRPPTEFNMPSVAFFEHRTPSQWLWEEDQKLRALVKEFTFNWSLVSQQLSLPSLFVSGSGRRTPWECFERWVQLEGLPAEMSKTQYFRTYQGRLEQANKTVFAQYQAQQQQQQQQQAQAPVQPRRRPTTTPIRVERRRENRHLAIIDGMRKLARKRESAAHKQAESQKAAALRKAHEPAAPKSSVHTPQEFSRLKWEREEKMKLRQQQQEMAVRQQMAAQRQAQMQAQGGMPNGANQMPRNGASMGNPNGSTQMANSASQQGHNNAAMAARAQQGQQGAQANFANGNMAGMPMGTPGVPQAQMQGNMQNGQRMGPPNQMHMAMQRGQFPNNSQQHQFQLQQQQINMASNMTQGMGMNNMPNANMMASMSNQNMNSNMSGAMNNGMNGMPNNVGSPRPNQVNGNMQNSARPLSSGHMPGILQLQNSLKVQHPEWSHEQVQKAASDQLQRYMAKQQRTQAMNAAAGSSGMSPSSQIGNNHYLPQNGGMANSPSAPNAVQNYQQQLVQQQRMMSQARQQAGSPGINNARPPSRSATPQNPQMQQQSPGLQQAQVNRS